MGDEPHFLQVHIFYNILDSGVHISSSFISGVHISYNILDSGVHIFYNILDSGCHISYRIMQEFQT